MILLVMSIIPSSLMGMLTFFYLKIIMRLSSQNSLGQVETIGAKN